MTVLDFPRFNLEGELREAERKVRELRKQYPDTLTLQELQYWVERRDELKAKLGC